MAELNPALLAECDRYNVPVAQRTRDYRDFLADADVVDIVTPTDSHFELCRTALGADKDVFVEKPMTATAAQARALEQLVQRTGRLIQVGYHYRLTPSPSRCRILGQRWGWGAGEGTETGVAGPGKAFMLPTLFPGGGAAQAGVGRLPGVRAPGGTTVNGRALAVPGS